MSADRCSFCERADVPLVPSKHAATCLECARLAVELLSPMARSSADPCPNGCDGNDATQCGVLRCWQAFQELPTGPCNCPCHGGAP